MTLNSPCKVNFLLNILGKRSDGFHELETVMHPVAIYDRLHIQRTGSGIQLSSDSTALPVDSRNLVYRAAESFLTRIKATDGVRIHLEKKIPLAAGLGGGSGNAAITLLGLNQLFDGAASNTELHEIAASLGSDIPFFLQHKPALATGRGEMIQPLDFFPALRNYFIVLVHPGFGISTPWAYQQLAHFPDALNGQPGRAARFIAELRGDTLKSGPDFYNSLEAPALKKFPLLQLFQEFFRENGADVALMSGSGSATFALVGNQHTAEFILENFKKKFGDNMWSAAAPLAGQTG